MLPQRELPPSSQFHPQNIEQIHLTSADVMAGRYAESTDIFSGPMSEAGLMRARIFVEGELLKEYSQKGLILPLKPEETAFIDSLTHNFDPEEAQKVKAEEKIADHDVVAVVNYMRGKFKEGGHPRLVENIHDGPTSEDIDNIALRLNVREARDRLIIPQIDKLIGNMMERIVETSDFAVIARTHGQPAGYTTFGRELAVFVERLQKQKEKFKDFQFEGKFSGIIGTFSGPRAAFPDRNLEWWINFSKEFIQSFGLTPIFQTSQNNPNDDLVEFLQIQQRINNILHGFDRDLWDFASRKLVRAKSLGAGSSTGAAKANPWRAEHSEAMTEMANGMIQVLVSQIEEYRLSRDLSDKTLMRFIGSIFAVAQNAYEYAEKQLNLIVPDKEKMERTIYEDLSPLSEALQLLLRNSGVPNAYEEVRKRTQGKEFTPGEWKSLIEQIITELGIADEALIKNLHDLSPTSFIIDATKLTEIAIEEIRASRNS